MRLGAFRTRSAHNAEPSEHCQTRFTSQSPADGQPALACRAPDSSRWTPRRRSPQVPSAGRSPVAVGQIRYSRVRIDGALLIEPLDNYLTAKGDYPA